MNDRVSRVQFWSAFLGNLFEHYDSALFGLLAPFLAPIFFPGQEAVPALILTYGIIPLGMLVRPIGSIFFGYFGTKYGRKRALVLSLLGMALISGLIGLSPTYSQIGVAAPLLLLFGRILQNFFASGEVIGGAVFLLEQTSEKHRDLVSSLYNTSTIAGILIASFGVSLLYSLNLLETHWRLLYLIGCLTALFGLVLRGNVRLSPSVEDASSPPRSLLQVFKSYWENRSVLFVVALASGFSYSCYSIALVLMNGFIPLVSEMTHGEVMRLNTLLLIFDLVTLPIFGLLARHFSRQKMMVFAAATAMFTGIPLFMLLEGAVFSTVVVVRLSLVLIGVWFSANFYSWSQSLLPSSQSYPIISFAYAIGCQVLGGPTVAISLWLYHQTQIVSSACLYWVALAAFSSIWIAKSVVLQENKPAFVNH